MKYIAHIFHIYLYTDFFTCLIFPAKFVFVFIVPHENLHIFCWRCWCYTQRNFLIIVFCCFSGFSIVKVGCFAHLKLFFSIIRVEIAGESSNRGTLTLKILSKCRLRRICSQNVRFSIDTEPKRLPIKENCHILCYITFLLQFQKSWATIYFWFPSIEQKELLVNSMRFCENAFPIFFLVLFQQVFLFLVFFK